MLNLRPMLLALALLTLTASLAHADSPASAPAKPPNIVLIFIDDMGYADVGPFGATDLRTPHIDQLAAGGMKFTSFYATPVCSMSRTCLMTGCYNARVSIPGVLFPKSEIGIGDKEKTIADLLKTKGYATACIGKWHLGWQTKFLPPNHGFDFYFGLPYSNDMGGNGVKGNPPLPLFRNLEVIEKEPDQSLLTKRYTEEACKFIDDHAAGPFFVYLPHTMVHMPVHASGEFKGKSKRGIYGDAVEEIDWSVGQILATLKKHNLENNTLVIFTSDNGPAGGPGSPGSAGPLRGRKGSNFEGGVREPCMMLWPGHIPAGTVCKNIAGNIDMLPTLASIAGAEVPTDRIIDGRNITSMMLDPKAGPVRDVHLYYTAQQTLQAIRVGDWKLFLHGGGKGKGEAATGGELYNLADDLGEAHNVAADHADIVAKLKKEAEERDGELQAHKRPAGHV